MRRFIKIRPRKNDYADNYVAADSIVAVLATKGGSKLLLSNGQTLETDDMCARIYGAIFRAQLAPEEKAKYRIGDERQMMVTLLEDHV